MSRFPFFWTRNTTVATPSRFRPYLWVDFNMLGHRQKRDHIFAVADGLVLEVGQEVIARDHDGDTADGIVVKVGQGMSGTGLVLKLDMDTWQDGPQP